MAIIPAVVTDFNRMGVMRIEWAAMATGDTGQPVDWAGHADRSVQVFGTFGGSSVAIEGSNDAGPTPTNWNVLTDPQGNALNITAAGLERVTEDTCWVRPNITGGTGSPITVQMLLRRK